ncbi:AraC family transcriptional regulator [Cohnella suwonensis]|uniref:AraC family transcriptional regulator n=1 Tax=Cohnella suwonensis TaxID=696072 RepID=A0ABW0M2X7_9BACL
MTVRLRGEIFFEDGFPIFLNRETEGFRTAMHRHDFFELSLVAEGRGRHYIGDTQLETTKGDLFVIPIGTRHVFRPDSASDADRLVVHNLVFDAAGLPELLRWLPEDAGIAKLLKSRAEAPERWLALKDEDRLFENIFMQAYLEYTERRTGYRPMIAALLLQVLQWIDRTTREKRSAVPVGFESPAPSQMRDAIDEALRFIDRNYSDKLTLKELADRAYMSVNHFQHHFKRRTGQTFNRYVQDVRIRNCCQLLRTTDKSVIQTAQEVGYSDMKHFHSLFRKMTGHSPRAFRLARV